MNVDFETIEPVAAEAPHQPTDQMLQLLFGKHITYSISGAARIGVADHMEAAPLPVDELAAKTQADAGALYRVMRMLAGVGVFKEWPGKRFSLTPVGETLKTGAPGSLRYLAMMWGDKWSTNGFGEFEHCLRTGQDGITKAYGKNVFELLAGYPDQADTFHRAMADVSAVAGEAIAAAYDFSGIRRLADVGGGHGMLLASILKNYPEVHGVLYDLPEVVTGAPVGGYLNGLNGRVDIQSGNFFERAPSGCDAYILKHILHDWSDEHCQTILKHIRKEVPAHGRVLACEMIVPGECGPAPAKMLDIEMLVLTVGGKERTADEFAELFRSAGLSLERIVPTDAPMCLIEARPL